MSGTLAAIRRRGSPSAVGAARIGPVALTFVCLLLIGALALLYLGQVGAVTAANQRLQTLQAEHERLLQQDQALHARLGAAQDPAYIDRRARALGLIPAAPGSAVVIVVPGLSGTQASAGQPGAGGVP